MRGVMNKDVLTKDVRDLVQAYNTDGVVVVRNVLTAYWLEALRHAVDHELQKGRRYFANRNMRMEGGVFLDFCLNSGIGRIAADLANARCSSLIFDHIFAKEAGTKTRTGWHTDQPYWPISGPIMTTWIALDPVDDDNGALEFIPGSHAWGKKYRPFKTGKNGEFLEYFKLDDPQYSDMPDFEAERERHTMVSWDLQPGDLLAFDGFMVHSAKGNRTSTRPRRGYAIRFATEGATYQPDQGVAEWLEDETLQPGDAFASVKFPLVYQADLL